MHRRSPAGDAVKTLARCSDTLVGIGTERSNRVRGFVQLVPFFLSFSLSRARAIRREKSYESTIRVVSVGAANQQSPIGQEQRGFPTDTHNCVCSWLLKDPVDCLTAAVNPDFTILSILDGISNPRTSQRHRQASRPRFPSMYRAAEQNAATV